MPNFERGPLYFASYGERCSDPIRTYVGLDANAVEEATDAAMEFEREDDAGICDLDHTTEEDGPESECSLCNPQLVSYGVSAEYRPFKSGFLTLADWRDIRNDVLAGRVAPLSR